MWDKDSSQNRNFLFQCARWSYMWATFSGQMGLSDAEIRSLATAMGCTAETLRRMYDRMSPTEKNRPINEAMRTLLPWHAQQAPEPGKDDSLMNITKKLSKLSPEKLRELQKFLEIDPAA